MTPIRCKQPNGTYWDSLSNRYIEPSDIDWSPDDYTKVSGDRLTPTQAIDLILANDVGLELEQ